MNFAIGFIDFSAAESVVPKQKGAHLLAPLYRHVDAYGEALSARPLRGALRTLSTVSKFPRFVEDRLKLRELVLVIVL
jgi:hypothetical protein